MKRTPKRIETRSAQQTAARSGPTWFVLVTALVGCATSSTTNVEARPGGMGVGEHEAAAEFEEERAALHSEHGAKGSGAIGVCTGSAEVRGVCWSSRANPSAKHRAEARRHERAAEEHRQAAAQLETTEKRACVSVAPPDRDQSPFSHREDIVDVAVDDAGTQVVVTFAAVSGLSVAHLQRIIDCHLARNASLGNNVEGMEYCPLVPPGVHAVVDKDAKGRLSVVLSAETEPSRAEIRKRALLLRSDAAFQADGAEEP